MTTVINFSNKQVTLVNGRVILPGEKIIINTDAELSEQIKALEKKGILVTA